jgi:nucleoside 2-deoxyribosyltransferase
MQRGNDPFQDLLSGDLVVYEVIQLWNYRDKIKGDDFETEILEGIRQAAAERGLVLEGFPVFLPFRDSDEEDIQSDDKAGEIYRADCLRLTEHCFSVIGFTEGLAKDAGVMWEYGFAYAVGLPTLLFVSDFFWWRMVRPGGSFRGETFIIDPLVDACIGKVLVENDLPLDGEDLLPTVREVVPQLQKKDQFRRRLERGRAKLLGRVREETRAMCLDAEPFIASPPHQRGGGGDGGWAGEDGGEGGDGGEGRDGGEGGEGGRGGGALSGSGHVFVEGEGASEWQRMMMADAGARLEAEGFPVKASRRFEVVERGERGDEGSLAEDILHDVEGVRDADALVVLGEGWDVAPGSAFLQGYAAALGIPIVVYYGSDRIFEAHGGTRMWVNLMLECSADVMAHSMDDIPAAVQQAIQGM